MTSSISSRITSSDASLFSIQESERYIEELELLSVHQLENEDDEFLLDFTGHITELANINPENLSPEEFQILQHDIQDITEEINNEINEETIVEKSQDGQNSSATKISKKKKHSKGFFKKTTRKVSHAVRDFGRFSREVVVGEKKHKHGDTVSLEQKKHKTKHVAKKIRHFIKKHKKELIIGAIIAGVLVTGGLLMAAIPVDEENKKRRDGIKKIPLQPEPLPSQQAEIPSEQIANPSEGAGSMFLHAFDQDHSFREEAIHIAEQKAREQRYTGLVHSQEDVERCKEVTIGVMEDFKSNFIGEAKNLSVFDVGEIAVFAKTISEIPLDGPTVKGLLDVTIATACAADFTRRNKEKVEELYKPVGEAYSVLYKLENENKQASAEKCEKEGYQPKLEFCPEAPQTDIHKSILTDKNNPNPNQIAVVMP